MCVSTSQYPANLPESIVEIGIALTHTSTPCSGNVNENLFPTRHAGACHGLSQPLSDRGATDLLVVPHERTVRQHLFCRQYIVIYVGITRRSAWLTQGTTMHTAREVVEVL